MQHLHDLRDAADRDGAAGAVVADDAFVVGSHRFASRWLLGTGKYRDFAQTRAAVDASGAEIVTVAIRRTNIGQDAGQPSLLDVLPPSRYTILPNTAGCYNADDAVRTLRLARELLSTDDLDHTLVKLEVLGDPHAAQAAAAAGVPVVDDPADAVAARSRDPAGPAALSGRAMIRITVNGEAQQLDDALSVGSLLEARGLTGKRIAVELNGAIVPRSRHATTPLVDSDRVEIVVAVGGG